MGSGSDTEGARHRVRGGGRSHHRTSGDAACSKAPPNPAPAVHLAHRLWLERDGELVFGPGGFELLRRVDQMGSLNQASKSMAMSYSKAWRVVREVEERLGVPLFERRIGGSDGGGSSLTDEARSLLARYGALRAEADDLFVSLFARHFSGVSYGPKETSPDGRGPTADEHGPQ
jgi:molybdate transport system regulatory protein